ncbi:putative cation-transporting ATPase [Cardiosporidium cionae]|uniref:Cation-transporting ATPase n=1 Tax=Cardiosporidium cionae TaxID=476202 RepID=A0ABQ7J6L6_9APIC|nr:putative cation-transporting ATPase [Cardiosporidium cionae]|eukprot:KAF8819569.1 putative cation-transporting ATPase [Cardiosporidium cionae]
MEINSSSSLVSLSSNLKHKSSLFKQTSFVFTSGALRNLQAIHEKYSAILRLQGKKKYSNNLNLNTRGFESQLLDVRTSMASPSPSFLIKDIPYGDIQDIPKDDPRQFLWTFSSLYKWIYTKSVVWTSMMASLITRWNRHSSHSSSLHYNLNDEGYPVYTSHEKIVEDATETLSVSPNKVMENSFTSTNTSIEDSSLMDVMEVAQCYVDFCNSLFETATVYARLSPMDKSSLVKSMQKLSSQPFVAMIGDGANDCDALNVADLSISLSASDASIAANFKSLSKSIKSCVTILIEGRAALVNSLQIFKFIFMYALIETTSVLLLYLYGTNFSDSQYVFVDIILILPLSIFMSWTHSASTLRREIPPKRLVEISVFCSIVGQSIIQILFQGIALMYLSQRSFYVRFIPDENTGEGNGSELASFENSQIFILSLWQYLSVCVAFSRNHPWRLSILTNPLLTFWLLFCTLFGIGFLFFPIVGFIGDIKNYYNLVPLPDSYNWILFSFAIGNFCITVLYECFVYWYFSNRVFIAVYLAGLPIRKKGRSLKKPLGMELKSVGQNVG